MHSACGRPSVSPSVWSRGEMRLLLQAALQTCDFRLLHLAGVWDTPGSPRPLAWSSGDLAFYVEWSLADTSSPRELRRETKKKSKGQVRDRGRQTRHLDRQLTGHWHPSHSCLASVDFWACLESIFGVQNIYNKRFFFFSLTTTVFLFKWMQDDNLQHW